MKLFTFEKRDDYGTDMYLSVLTTKRHSFLQFSLSFCEYSSWPYIQLSLGQNCLLGFFCYFYKIGFDIELIGRTWRI